VSLIKSLSDRTLCISLQPGQFSCALREGRVFIAETAYQQTIDNPDGHWHPVLAACQAWLRQSERPSAGLPLSVTLSSRWCHLQSVPWSDAMLAEATAQRFLQTQFIALYDDAARDWVVNSDDAPYGQPRMACGIERELLDGLQEIATENAQPLRAVESVIPLAWRAIAAAKAAQGRAVAVIEPGRISFAGIHNKRLVAIQSQSFVRPWDSELPQAWRRWVLRSPELADISQVAVLNLSGVAASSELPQPFHHVLLPSYGLAPTYAFLTCNSGQ
jgi:hypothetical protein